MACSGAVPLHLQQKKRRHTVSSQTHSLLLAKGATLLCSVASLAFEQVWEDASFSTTTA